MSEGKEECGLLCQTLFGNQSKHNAIDSVMKIAREQKQNGEDVATR
jgi:hypothetical protein